MRLTPIQQKTSLNLRHARTRRQMQVVRMREELVRARVYAVEHTPASHDVLAEEARTAASPTREARKPLLPAYLRIVSLLLLVLASWQVLPTVAASLSYFTDTEAGPAQLASGLIDLTVTDPSDTIVGCGSMADLLVPVEVETNGFAARASASTTRVTGDVAFCSALELDVQHQGPLGNTLLYTGPVSGFVVPSVATGTLRFIASLASGLPLGDTATCTMEIRFDAWLASTTRDESGFTDSDTTYVTFVVDPGTCADCPPKDCVSCGDTVIINENENHATVTNEFVVNTHTGGSSAQGAAGGGARGTITTGSASSSANSTTTVNVNETSISVSSCGCGAGCTCEEVPGDEVNSTEAGEEDGKDPERTLPTMDDIKTLAASTTSGV